MEFLYVIDISKAMYYGLLIAIILMLFRAMFNLVLWGKRMPKGTFVFLAIFPLISLFPIPGQEIKKLERIKQEQIKNEDESSET
ncbi:hypothetical protein [Shewanella maritima]|uniref:hypothetical protein n=1 Tax=Shewanella maritima TaxID=2520507 RepID=UPI0037355E42